MKESNFKKKITNLVIALVLLIAVYLIANALEANDIQFGSSNSDYGLYYVGNAEIEEILNDMSGEGFFVYIGTPTCPFCQQFEPVLQETLEYLGKELRYFHIDLARDDDEEAMVRNLNSLETDTVPTIVYIENGVVLDSMIGSPDQEVIISFFEANGGLN